MTKKFIIKKRYECITSAGKHFTDWFMFDSNPVDEKTGNEIIKQAKQDYKDIERITKQKHEYMLYDYEQHLQDIADYEKQIAQKHEDEKRYRESDEYRELLKRKRVEAKERKKHQKQYMETYNKDDDEKN